MAQSLHSAMRPLPTREQITQRAHEIFLERGGQPGRDIDDWLQAEYELMQLPVRKIAKLAAPKNKKISHSKSALISLVQAALLLGGSGLTRFCR